MLGQGGCENKKWVEVRVRNDMGQGGVGGESKEWVMLRMRNGMVRVALEVKMMMNVGLNRENRRSVYEVKEGNKEENQEQKQVEGEG